MKKLVLIFVCLTSISFGESDMERFTIVNDRPLTHEVLYDYLVAVRAWYPDIMLMQARIESGNYTSPLYRDNNNLYGMRPAKVRQHIQTGENRGYAVYESWQTSVLDRIYWDFYTFGEKPTREEYLQRLKGYAQDKDYIKLITQ